VAIAVFFLTALVTVLGAVGGSLVMALPYLLVRLVDDFADVPRVVPPLALLGLLLAVVALFALAASPPIVITPDPDIMK